MALEPTPVFLHRPGRAPAASIDGSAARPERAVRAVLQTADGGVLVKSIIRQPDGSFIGEVYGVTPRQRHVAPGDPVSFSESQIFTFKAADVEPMSPGDAEVADMARAFDDSFSGADAHIVSPAAAAGPAVADFSFDLGADSSRDQPEKKPAPPVAAESRPARAAPPAPAPAPAPAAPATAAAPPPATPAPAAAPPPAAPAISAPLDQELSTAEAYSILGASDQDSGKSEHGRAEPVLVDHTPPAEVSIAARQPLACLECGATLTLAAASGAPSETPPILKVSCAYCGRINDVAQAEAASRRRRSFTP
jgi:hypothetical protein